jgi:hypothetical protein
LSVLRFEFRVSHLLGKHSTAWSTHPSPRAKILNHLFYYNWQLKITVYKTLLCAGGIA